MLCVVCERSAKEVRLISINFKTICASCKTAYYRALTKLYEFLFQEKKYRNKNFQNVENLNFSVFSYLDNPSLCLKNQKFTLDCLCGVKKIPGVQGTICNICRFRKSVLKIDTLAVTKGKKTDQRHDEISILLCLHSMEILEYCNKMVKIPENDRKDKNLSLIKRKTAIPITVNYNPISSLHDQMLDVSGSTQMQPHLHNRFNNQSTICVLTDQVTWSTLQGDKVPEHISRSIYNQINQFKTLDRQIFFNLLKSALTIQMHELSMNKTSDNLKLDSFINDCMPDFQFTLMYLRFIASENSRGELQAAPYGKISFPKSMIFSNLTIEYGFEDAEEFFKTGIPVINMMKHFSPYQLMLCYLMIFSHTISDDIFVNYPFEVKAIVDGFQSKISSLCQSLSLFQKSMQIIAVAMHHRKHQKEKGSMRYTHPLVDNKPH